jgi:hypothetical protein
MSWQITVNDIDRIADGAADDVLATVGSDNPEYIYDATLALVCARDAGLVSATLSGGRTPSPYGGPDTVVISVIGFSDRRVSHAVPPQVPPNQETSPAELMPGYWPDESFGFYDTMARTILAGPDKEDDVGSGTVQLPHPAGGAGGSDGN